MRTKLRYVAIIAGISFVALLASGQSIDDELHFITKTQSPIHEIYLALEGKYHWPLTYEEAPIFLADELTTLRTPTGMTTLIRRASPMSVNLSTEELSASGSERLNVINSLLAAYTQSGNSGSFRTNNSFISYRLLFAEVTGINRHSNQCWTRKYRSESSIFRQYMTSWTKSLSR